MTDYIVYTSSGLTDYQSVVGRWRALRDVSQDNALLGLIEFVDDGFKVTEGLRERFSDGNDVDKIAQYWRALEAEKIREMDRRAEAGERTLTGSYYRVMGVNELIGGMTGDRVDMAIDNWRDWKRYRE